MNLSRSQQDALRKTLKRSVTVKTGWPAGLLQDDSKELSRWFASRIDARWALRRALGIK